VSPSLIRTLDITLSDVSLIRVLYFVEILCFVLDMY
jgi:hypothetical protein